MSSRLSKTRSASIFPLYSVLRAIDQHERVKNLVVNMNELKWFFGGEKKGDGKRKRSKMCLIVSLFVSFDVAMLLRNTNEGILAVKRAEFSAKLLWKLKGGGGVSR